jgi:hypothetical protein
MMFRSRSRSQTFQELLAEQKACFEKDASKLKPGPERDGLLRRAQQIDTASHINQWLSSPSLQPPR